MDLIRRFFPSPAWLASLIFAVPFSFLSLFHGVAGNFVRAGEPASGQVLKVRSGDHISIIGNTLADRMQHDGWLEAYFQSRFPKHQLVFRNLGFSGDELTLRLRSANFGSPDEWLTRTRTDMVFAFFGYNESFAGDAGMPKFKQDLDAFVKQTLARKYNGKGVPRLVLFSPIAHEDLHNPNLPDGKANNRRLEKYTAAMAEVARANQVAFVDLFHPSKALYEKAVGPLTINGVHLNEHGNEEIAKVIDRALFPNGPEPKRTTEHLDRIRQAVLDKNFYWFNRYRTVDGFNVYGGRADLSYNSVTNRTVMQREMEVLDTMTANRDKRVWAVAQGGDLKVDDSNTPPFIPVQTNKPGPLPGGRHIFLGGEEAIKKMTVGKGMKVNLFASEKEFPELTNAVQMAFDAKGRLWVAVWPSYPHWKPKEEMNDKILILEDTDGDGKADKCTVFADHLHCPTGFTLWGGGALVAQAPDLMFLKDTSGDGKADLKVRVLSGLDSADTHHTSNSFVIDPGGALYFQEGVFHRTQVESPYGPSARCADAGVFRYEPRTQKFEVYVNYGFANPHGHVFDRWGQDIVVDGTGANPYHAALFSGQVDYPHRHHGTPQVYRPKTRPCPGMEILSSRHFPDDMQGHLLVANVIGFQGILRYKVLDKGASFTAQELEPILSSSDPNFRPSDIRVGPDGAIYFLDWHNPIIGHMQHHLRDPNRDREHGRIYRVTYEGRPLLKSPPIAGEPVDKLLDLLKEPEDRVRYRTRIELSDRKSDDVVAAVQKWLTRLDSKDAGYEHHLLEALWLHQAHNVVNEGLLRRMLRSSDFRARAAATRVLCYWRDRVKQPLELLRTQINDEQPRVRLEAIRALSFFHDQAALPVALELLAHPDDEYIRYVFNETLNTLERRLGGGAQVDRKNIATTLLRMLDKGKLPAERQAVLLETVCRHGQAKELQTVWDQIVKGAYPPVLRKRVLEWLADAATTRHVRPTIDANEIEAHLQAIHRSRTEYATEAVELVRLTAAWKVRAGATGIGALAKANDVPAAVRQAAIDALVVFADPGSIQALRDLSQAAKPMALRFHAAAALAQVDLDAGSRAAVAAIASSKDGDDPTEVVQALLVRKGGPEQLAAALSKEKISADAAKRILRAMYLAGRNDAALADVVGRLAGLEATPKAPTPDEVRQIAGEVQQKGDARRGEHIFRRLDLGCMKCHALNKAGGGIGPDLGPIGSSSPIDYIITSILDPNAAIKEEYLTKTIVTTSGAVLTGIVTQRDKNQVVLKDATGKRLRIATSEISEEANGKSLMPEGVTRILTHAELLDLIRFVSELGKSGPFAIPGTPTVQVWKRLRQVPAVLREGVPNRDVLRDTLLASNPQAWDVVYAQVNGQLPLDEPRRPDKGEVIYLQGEFQVVQAGSVEIGLKSSEPVMFWVDEESFEKQTRATLALPVGRHRITVRLQPGDVANPHLRVELARPAHSRAHFEVVHGDN
jgi:putative heme-binding domain-containing protein